MTGHGPISSRGLRSIARVVASRAARVSTGRDLGVGSIAVVTASVIIATLLAITGPLPVEHAMASTTQPSKGTSPRCTVPAHVKKDQVVAVVADFGGANGKVLATCVAVMPGVSGAQVLVSQAARLGYPPPRYSGSGLLCSIDGYPPSGCGTQSGTHYAYWAYFHGGKRWQYASGGPGEWKVSEGDVEGWRFEPDGSATPADPPPRARSSAAALEMPAKAVPTTTTPSKGSAAGPIRSSRGPGRLPARPRSS